MKQQILVTGPVKTRSGYGNHARDICRALIELDKYDVIVNSVRWGSTPMNALEDGNKHHEAIKARILKSPQLPKQPELHLHIVVPNTKPCVKNTHSLKDTFSNSNTYSYMKHNQTQHISMHFHYEAA